MKKYSEIIKKSKDGVTINLFTTPNSKKRVFPAGYNQWRKRIEIKVCSDAKENKANKEVIKTVAEYLNKSVKNVSVVSGEKSREKTILIKGAFVDAVVKRLKESLDGL